tara:strand:+ start:168 stop:461 length:294 start_codon:yes stop_codon:yes gene_type:complete
MCGIVGAYSLKDKTKNVYPLVVRGLLDLQHRGQLSAGITSYNTERKRILQTHKDNGKVHEVFQINHISKVKNFLLIIVVMLQSVILVMQLVETMEIN